MGNDGWNDGTNSLERMGLCSTNVNPLERMYSSAPFLKMEPPCSREGWRSIEEEMIKDKRT